MENSSISFKKEHIIENENNVETRQVDKCLNSSHPLENITNTKDINRKPENDTLMQESYNLNNEDCIKIDLDTCYKNLARQGLNDEIARFKYEFNSILQHLKAARHLVCRKEKEFKILENENDSLIADNLELYSEYVRIKSEKKRSEEILEAQVAEKDNIISDLISKSKKVSHCKDVYQISQDGTVDISSVPKEIIAQTKYPYYDYITWEGEKLVLRSNRCDLCHVNFKTYEGLNTHKRSHHK